jgi:hypothetical protein
VALWQVYRARPTAALVIGGIAVVLLGAALFIRPAAVAFHRAWMGLAGVLGYVNTRILLSLMFYVLMTPVGCILRVSGHDPLERRTRSRDSYWIRRGQSRQRTEQFERAF